MPDSAKKTTAPHRTKSLHKPPVKRRHSVVTPIEEAKPLPTVTPALEPVVIPTLPVQSEPILPEPTPTLIKTTYNLDGFKKLGLVAGGLVLVGLVAVGYSQRNWLQHTFTPIQATTPAYQLKVASPKTDAKKSQASLEQLHSTAQAIQSGQLSVSVPTAEVLTTYSYDQLVGLLMDQIQQLQSEHQAVSGLQTYLSRAADVQANQPDAAKALLQEGIQLAQEVQRLYLYSQN